MDHTTVPKNRTNTTLSADSSRAGLLGLANELIIEIVQYVQRATSAGFENEALSQAFVNDVDTLWRSITSLRVQTKRLKSLCDATFARQISSLSPELSFHFRKLNYVMTTGSLKRLEGIANNKHLAPLIEEIRYIGIPAQPGQFGAEWRGSTVPTKQSYPLAATRTYYIEHERNLRLGMDKQILKKVTAQLRNLKAISFERKEPGPTLWNTYPFSFVVLENQSNSTHKLRNENPSAVAKPNYWHGFWNLIQSTVDMDIKTLRLVKIAPDVSQNKREELHMLRALFGRVTNLEINIHLGRCARHSPYQTRNYFEQEALAAELEAWRALITDFPNIKDFMLKISGPIRDIKLGLTQCIIREAQLPYLQSLQLTDLPIEVGELESFFQRNGHYIRKLEMNLVCLTSKTLAGIFLFQSSVSAYHRGFSCLKRLPNLREITLLLCSGTNLELLGIRDEFNLRSVRPAYYVQACVNCGKPCQKFDFGPYILGKPLPRGSRD